MKPVLTLVGRPNVGKSTLFNRITKTRDAIVADMPGLTRDRHYGDARLDSLEFLVVDTGGLEVESGGVFTVMARQTELAMMESDVIVFVLDAKAGLLPQDFEIAKQLRRLGRRVHVAVNKAEGLKNTAKLAEFYELGLGEIFAISAAHGEGVKYLLDEVLAPWLNQTPEETPVEEDEHTIRLAVAGRPNAGKSTLINTWLGEERLVAFDQPGTTRDAIYVPFERGGVAYQLIDTAGLRRKGKVFEAVEKFSVIKTLQAIDQAHVVLLLIDAEQGVTDQDAHIANYILESGRAVVVAVNKNDAIDAYQREQLGRTMAHRLGFLQFADVHLISAKKRQGLNPIWKSITQAHKAAFAKLSTPKLTRVLQDALAHQAPERSGMFKPKPRYAHQGGMNPPVIVVHGNSLEHMSDSYRRYLENSFRKAFELHGTPLRVQLKTKANPYADKK